MKRAAVLLAILAVNVGELVELGRARFVLLACVLVASLLTRSLAVVDCALVVVASGLCWQLGVLDVPVLGMLVPLGVVLVWNVVATRRAALPWLRRGQLDRTTWILVVATAIGSTLALVAWARWNAAQGAGIQLVGPLAHLPKVLLVGVLVPGFALVNAFAEELVFRGVVQEATNEAFGGAVSIVLAATAFAAVHYRGGFPNGRVGYAMVLVYGIALGLLRNRTRGIFAPWLAHVLADATIGALVVLGVAR